MLQTLTALAALFVSAGLFITGNGLLQTLVSVGLGAAGVDLTVASIVLSGYYVGLVLGALAGPRLIARVGHIRAFAALASLVSITTLLHAFLAPDLVWLAMRVATGFALAGLFIATESWLNDRAPTALRGAVFALYMIVNFTAMGAGQFMLRLAPTDGFDLYALVSMLFSLALIPIAVVRIATPSMTAQRRLNFVQLYRLSPLAIVGCAIIGLMNGAFATLAPLFASGVGLDLKGVSWFMGSAIFGGLALQWPIGRLSDRFDRRMVLIAVAATAVFVAGALVLATYTFAAMALGLIYPIVAIYGGCIFTLYPLCVANANDFAKPEERVAVSGGLLLAFGVGAAAGPLLAAPIMGTLGPRGLFVFTAGIASTLTLFAIYRRRVRASPPAESRPNFVAAAPTPYANPPDKSWATEKRPSDEPDDPEDRRAAA